MGNLAIPHGVTYVYSTCINRSDSDTLHYLLRKELNMQMNNTRWAMVAAFVAIVVLVIILAG